MKKAPSIILADDFGSQLQTLLTGYVARWRRSVFAPEGLARQTRLPFSQETGDLSPRRASYALRKAFTPAA